MVRCVVPVDHIYSVWFVAIIDPTGSARYTRSACRLVDPVVIAERQVRARTG
jgi:hypothetical protein